MAWGGGFGVYAAAREVRRKQAAAQTEADRIEARAQAREEGFRKLKTWPTKREELATFKYKMNRVCEFAEQLGRSNIHLLIMQANCAFVTASKRREYLAQLNTALESGAEVEALDRRGLTPAHLAAEYLDLEVLGVLISYGANFYDATTATSYRYVAHIKEYMAQKAPGLTREESLEADGFIEMPSFSILGGYSVFEPVAHINPSPCDLLFKQLSCFSDKQRAFYLEKYFQPDEVGFVFTLIDVFQHGVEAEKLKLLHEWAGSLLSKDTHSVWIEIIYQRLGFLLDGSVDESVDFHQSFDSGSSAASSVAAGAMVVATTAIADSGAVVENAAAEVSSAGAFALMPAVNLMREIDPYDRQEKLREGGPCDEEGEAIAKISEEHLLSNGYGYV